MTDSPEPQVTARPTERALYVWGPRVRAEREHLGWTQADLARKSNVPQPTISRLERGSRALPDDARLRIALALRLNPYDLFPYLAAAG